MQDHDSSLLEADCQSDAGPKIPSRQQHLLVPTLQRSHRIHHRCAPQPLPKLLLHPPVPAIRHAARSRIPCGDKCRTSRAEASQQCIRHTTAYDDIASRGTVPRQTIGTQQTWRDRISLRRAPR
jgi:hypothetical protein